MQRDPNLNPNATSGEWGLLGKVVLGILSVFGMIGLWVGLTSHNSDDTGSATIGQKRPPVNSPQAGRSAASISIGDNKRIRVGNPTSRTDMPVFKTKDALMTFLRAVDTKDSAGMIATLPDTFRVDDYTQVQVIDYAPVSNGLFGILVLEGPQKHRIGWVMDIDLRD